VRFDEEKSRRKIRTASHPTTPAQCRGFRFWWRSPGVLSSGRCRLLAVFPLRRQVGGIDGFGPPVSENFTPAGRASRIAERGEQAGLGAVSRDGGTSPRSSSSMVHHQP
jgi:hypothetical protein